MNISRNTLQNKEILISVYDDATLVVLMLIGIMSDSHDNLSRTREAVSRFNTENVELVLHAGDIISPFMIGVLKDLNAKMVGVFGNNDGDRVLLEKKCAEHPHLSLKGTFTRLTVGKISVGLLHGSDLELLNTLMSSEGFDLLVYGHTHQADIRTNGKMLIVNPGEVYGYLTGKSTIAIVNTENRRAEIISLP